MQVAGIQILGLVHTEMIYLLLAVKLAIFSASECQIDKSRPWDAGIYSFGTETVYPPDPLVLGVIGQQSNVSVRNDTQVLYRVREQNGCKEFIPKISEECKYYDDCCSDIIRIKEKLAPGTYSCKSTILQGLSNLYSLLVMPSSFVVVASSLHFKFVNYKTQI